MLPEVEEAGGQVEQEENGVANDRDPNHRGHGRLRRGKSLGHPGFGLRGQRHGGLDGTGPLRGRVQAWRLDDVAQGAIGKAKRRRAFRPAHHLAASIFSGGDGGERASERRGNENKPL